MRLQIRLEVILEIVMKVGVCYQIRVTFLLGTPVGAYVCGLLLYTLRTNIYVLGASFNVYTDPLWYLFSRHR